MSSPRPPITALILAGGRGTRMGTVDKGLQPFRGKPMVAHVIERIAPQVSEVIINANQNLDAYAAFGHRVIADEVTGFVGPLAGFERGLTHAASELVVTAPCDSPFLPADLVERLYAQLKRHDAEVAVAKTGDQAQPVFCLMKKPVLDSLRDFLRSGQRKIDLWYAARRVVEAPFDDEADAFRNINTLEDKSALE
ncbi:MAG: molybdenum cofactor guanylyltransferase [Betaproteobacteria bacterium]|nr:molybdenum cofactor guanylyltransferase [Betaproteobacteria bacterium]